MIIKKYPSGRGLEQLIPCVQMDTDADDGGKERIMRFPVYHHAVQPVIIEYPVIDPFSSRTLVINFFVSICTARDIRV